MADPYELLDALRQSLKMKDERIAELEVERHRLIEVNTKIVARNSELSDELAARLDADRRVEGMEVEGLQREIGTLKLQLAAARERVVEMEGDLAAKHLAAKPNVQAEGT